MTTLKKAQDTIYREIRKALKHRFNGDLEKAIKDARDSCQADESTTRNLWNYEDGDNFPGLPDPCFEPESGRYVMKCLYETYTGKNMPDCKDLE